MLEESDMRNGLLDTPILETITFKYQILQMIDTHTHTEETIRPTLENLIEV